MDSSQDYRENSQEPLIIKNVDTVKNEAIISLILIIGVSVMILFYFIYITFISKNKESNIINRFNEFYGMSLSQLSIGLIIAFLISDVISSFNTYIMNPIVLSVFPAENIWSAAVNIPRDKAIYPGVFFQSFVSFVLSIFVLFILAEIFNRLFYIIKYFIPNLTIGIFVKYIFYSIIFFIFVGLTVWNSIEIANPKEESITQQQFLQRRSPFFLPNFRLNL